MKFGVVNKSTILNRIVLHTLQRNITHLAVITRITNIKLCILKGGTGKEPSSQIVFHKLNFQKNQMKFIILIFKKSRNGQNEFFLFTFPSTLQKLPKLPVTLANA